MADDDELSRLITAGRETLGIEFKASMNWTHPATKAKVIKAALAFANKRDGGVLVFGVEPRVGRTGHEVIGMSDGDFLSFTQDDVAARVNAHATPHIELAVEHRILDGKKIVAIVVQEFSDYPAMCSADFVADGKAVVTRGKLYCRSRRMAESTEVRSPDDMRDVIDLATAKGLERYFRLRDVERRATRPSDEEQFRNQLGDFEP